MLQTHYQQYRIVPRRSRDLRRQAWNKSVGVGDVGQSGMSDGAKFVLVLSVVIGVPALIGYLGNR